MVTFFKILYIKVTTRKVSIFNDLIVNSNQAYNGVYIYIYINVYLMNVVIKRWVLKNI